MFFFKKFSAIMSLTQLVAAKAAPVVGVLYKKNCASKRRRGVRYETFLQRQNTAGRERTGRKIRRSSKAE